MRTIAVNNNNWLQNVKTGEIKLAANLTEKDKNKEQWRILTRQERRKMKFKGVKK